MTTEHQITSNRENAAKSTGPRTAAGKARSSGNALKHGLTQGPSESAVMTWYEMLTGHELEPGRVPRTRAECAAMELAATEAQLALAVAAEERFMEDPENGADMSMHLRHVRETVREAWRTKMGRTPVQPTVHSSRSPAQIKEKWTPEHQHHARLARYRKAAEVRRHKALQKWLSVLAETKSSERTQFRAQVA